MSLEPTEPGRPERAAPAAPAESALARGVRAVAILVFGVTLFLPVHSCGPGPRPVGARQSATVVRNPPAVQVPLEQLYDQLSWGHRRGGAIEAVWQARPWYPYLLLPVWLLALALCGTGPRGARAAGAAVLALSVAVLALEVPYVARDFGGILPRSLHSVEVIVALVVVVAVLWYRRPGRSLLDAEAGISAQALLSALHAFTFIGNDVRAWSAEGAALGPIVKAVFANYLPAFWVATAALLVAAAPAYLARAPRVAPVAAPAVALTPEPLSPSR